MDKFRNCMNCGAPFDPELDKCSYCGTSYFDLSALDLSSEKPIMLKLKIGNSIITQLVVPVQQPDIIMQNETHYAYGRHDKPRISFTQNTITTTLQFQSVPMSKTGQIIIIQEEK